MTSVRLGFVRNDRVLAVPVAARRAVALSARVRQEIEQFFIAATVLEGKEPCILGWDDGDTALELSFGRRQGERFVRLCTLSAKSIGKVPKYPSSNRSSRCWVRPIRVPNGRVDELTRLSRRTPDAWRTRTHVWKWECPFTAWDSPAAGTAISSAPNQSASPKVSAQPVADRGASYVAAP